MMGSPAGAGGRFEALRRKFVALTMAVVVGVLVVVGLSVNVANYLATTASVDSLVELVGNESELFERPDRHGPFERDDDDDLDFWRRPFTEETAFATRWFSASWVEGGGLAEVNLSHIASVSTTDLPRYLNAVAQSADGFGWVGDFRYQVETDDGIRAATFLDASNEIHAMRLLAMLTALVMLASTALIFALVWALSKRLMRPVIEADLRQRRFVTDASHELKTPLAVIRTSLGVLSMDIGDNRWVDKAQNQAAHLGELVDELVTLSKLDEQVERPKMRFDASAVAADVVEGFGDHAAAQGHELLASVEPDLDYTGDELGFRQLLSILLDNAVRYAAAGGAITLALSRHRRRGLELLCANPATGLGQADLERLFERFWRPDEARSRETGGFGVGLSIAREWVEDAGGTITASLARIPSAGSDSAAPAEGAPAEGAPAEGAPAGTAEGTQAGDALAMLTFRVLLP